MPVPQSVSTASWTAAARPREVPGLRRAVTRFAADHGVVEPPIDGLRLAVSEAVTNAIVHGFGDGDPGQVRVSLAIDRSTQSWSSW
jgi:serine/threonine-protein kinase RsbW/stage II sporulation protein AB (anti-sigma F factor)